MLHALQVLPFLPIQIVHRLQPIMKWWEFASSYQLEDDDAIAFLANKNGLNPVINSRFSGTNQEWL
jgi:hypothetical protein